MSRNPQLANHMVATCSTITIRSRFGPRLALHPVMLTSDTTVRTIKITHPSGREELILTHDTMMGAIHAYLPQGKWYRGPSFRACSTVINALIKAGF